jgi:hypothetical protein
MSTKFLLIDDDVQSGDAPAERYAEKLTLVSKGALTVDTYRPQSIDKVLARIVEEKPDGLLVDVAFTNALTEEHVSIAYDGMALAQQIRTSQTRGLRQSIGANLPEFPLVRLSKLDVIREFIKGDTTGEDLFDEKVDKADVIEHAESIVPRLISLAADYPRVSEYAALETKTEDAVAHLLGVPEEFLARLDARTLLGLRRVDAPAHVLSRYVIGSLLGRPGPLIDEALVAVRFGIDTPSSENWPAVLEHLKLAAYQGVFADGYRRWWMPLVLDWWATTIDDKQAPFRLAAADRVRMIQEKTKIGHLRSIAENPDSPGTKFWQRCIVSKLPVDPAFGFPLMAEWGQETWHDVDYLCQEEAMRDPRNTRLAPTEQSRLARLRKGNNPG